MNSQVALRIWWYSYLRKYLYITHVMSTPYIIGQTSYAFQDIKTMTSHSMTQVTQTAKQNNSPSYHCVRLNPIISTPHEKFLRQSHQRTRIIVELIQVSRALTQVVNFVNVKRTFWDRKNTCNIHKWNYNNNSRLFHPKNVVNYSECHAAMQS